MNFRHVLVYLLLKIALELPPFLRCVLFPKMAVGQNLRYLFGVGYPPKVVYFKGFWDVHREYRGFDPLPNDSLTGPLQCESVSPPYRRSPGCITVSMKTWFWLLAPRFRADGRWDVVAMGRGASLNPYTCRRSLFEHLF